MTSGVPDYTDEEARRRLLRLGDDQLSGSSPPAWPAGHSTMPPERSAMQAGAPMAQSSNRVARPAGGVPSTMSASNLAPRRGQVVSWVALALGLAASISVGSGLYAALDSVAADAVHPLAGVSDAASWLVFGLVAALAAVVLSVIAVFTARPKLVATIALVLSLLGPWVGAILGAKFGASSVADHTAGLIGPIIELIRSLFG